MHAMLARALLTLTASPHWDSLLTWTDDRLAQVHADLETAAPDRVRFHQGEAALLHELRRLRASAEAQCDADR